MVMASIQHNMPNTLEHPQEFSYIPNSSIEELLAPLEE